MQIKQKLTGAFVAVVLVPLTVIIFVNNSMMEEAIYSTYEEKAKAIAARIVDIAVPEMQHTVSNYVQFLSQDSELTRAAYYATSLGSTVDLQAVLPRLRRRLHLSFIEVIDQNRHVVHSTLTGQSDATAAHDDDVASAHAGDQHASLHFDRDIGKFVIHAASVVSRKGKPIAIVQGGHILDKKALKVLAGDGLISLYDPTAKYFTTTGVTELDKPWIRAVFEKTATACKEDSASEACARQRFGIARKTVKGIPYLLVATPIRAKSGEPLGTLVVAQDAGQMENDLANAHNTTVFVGLGGIVVAILLGSFIARNLSRPIIELKNAALSMGKGNLDARVDIESADELGVLARAFNDMGEALSGSTVSKDYMENILRSMADALIVLDTEGHIRRVNHATLEMLGYTEDELLSLDMASLIADEALLAELSRDTAGQRSVSHLETVCRAKDGREIYVSLSSARVHNADNIPQGMVYVVQDITERKLAHAELERTNRQLDQFAYVVSHDLKAPLRAIGNLSTWIEEDLGPVMQEDTRKNMDLLRGRVGRMEALINGILEYSRVGRIDVDVTTVDTSVMLKDIIDSMPVPEGMTISIDPGMPTLEAAGVPLGQVFSNLISNAIKYRERDNGRIDISVRDVGAFYEFAVADDGPGIDPEYHEKIFVIFQTLAARDTVESTGVGLSLVKKIVEEQGGTITVESAEGRGATFRFTWVKQPKKEQAA